MDNKIISRDLISNKMYNIYSQCLIEANKSILRYRHGCIATYGGKIIARGCNTPKYDKNTCTCHAEVNVLHKLYNNYNHKRQTNKIERMFRKTTLYISRLSQAGISYDSAPCVDCLNVIKLYNIKKVIFCLDNEYYIIKPNTYNTLYESQGHKYAHMFND